jgi:DNA anti-recombination protein RmuC
MADLTKIDHAFDRFEAALRRVEVAMLRSQERDARAKLVAGEADALRHDRSRLAQELDDVRSKASELVGTNKQAVNKIDTAMSRIRAVLHSNSGGG